jgi:hypothetical protein
VQPLTFLWIGFLVSLWASYLAVVKKSQKKWDTWKLYFLNVFTVSLQFVACWEYSAFFNCIFIFPECFEAGRGLIYGFPLLID